MWDWDPDRREELLQRLAGGGVRPEDVETIRAVLTSCRQIAEWTREEGMTVDRLRPWCWAGRVPRPLRQARRITEGTMKPQPKPPEILELDPQCAEEIVQRVEAVPALQEDAALIRAAFASLAYLTNLLQQKSISVARLKKLLFGAPTETTASVLDRAAAGATSPPADAGGGGAASAPAPPGDARPKPARVMDVTVPTPTAAPSASRCPTNPWKRATAVRNAKTARCTRWLSPPR